MPISGGGGIITISTSDSVAFTNFQARTSLDGPHTTNYRNLLNGLTTDGLFNGDGTSSFFDFLYIFATQDSTTALLNLVSTSYTATAHGSPSFTVDQGYTGVDSSTTVFLDSGFPATAVGAKFSTNSCHTSVWSNTNTTPTATGGWTIGVNDAASPGRSELLAKYNDGNTYYRINDNFVSPTAGITNANSTGHYLANRSGVSAQQGYKNSVDQGVTPVAAGVISSATIYVLNVAGFGGPPAGGAPFQITMASAGASLSSTQVTNFYNRLRTYMTAVGIP